MSEQIARFVDEGSIAIEGRERFTSRLGGGVVRRRDVSNCQPLCFGVDAKKRLKSGVRQIQETISAFLDGRSGECNRREQDKKQC